MTTAPTRKPTRPHLYGSSKVPVPPTTPPPPPTLRPTPPPPTPPHLYHHRCFTSYRRGGRDQEGGRGVCSAIGVWQPRGWCREAVRAIHACAIAGTPPPPPRPPTSRPSFASSTLTTHCPRPRLSSSLLLSPPSPRLITTSIITSSSHLSHLSPHFCLTISSPSNVAPYDAGALRGDC